MAETAATTPSATDVAIAQLKTNIFASSLGTIGLVGAVVWAAQKKKTGKFWWGLGGLMVGSAVGRAIDFMRNSK
jgi:hypothetical protein